MAFPGFNASGVIPPFLSKPEAADRSPYETDLTTIVNTLGFSPERRAILDGLLQYRRALREVGITAGFQILDGSFMEDCEGRRLRPPGDIDLVTFAHLPVPPNQVPQFAADNHELFDHDHVKAHFRCDAFFVDLGKHSELIVEDTFYWYGLFSHQRDTFTWKGMLRVPLMADDANAGQTLLNIAGGANGP